jgi:MoaA/NifB/PqqE/SkfB family radical SAM enzyme
MGTVPIPSCCDKVLLMGPNATPADFIASELPRVLWIELTSKCPYDCVFCSRRVRRGDGEHMDFDLYRRLISDLRDPELIRLNYSGESMHYPHLIEAICLAKAAGAETELVSVIAGTSEERFRALVESGLDRLTISLHSMNPEVFQEIYRSSSLENMKRSISLLIRAKREASSVTPRIDISFVATMATLPELPAVAAFARESGIEEVSVIPVIRRDKIPAEFRQELENGKLRPQFQSEIRQSMLLATHIAKGIRISSCNEDQGPEIRLGSLPKPWCAPLPAGAKIRSCEQNPWETVHILSDGSVVVCEVQDHVPLGNAAQQSLREIWQGENYREFRRRYVDGAVSECAQCAWKTAHFPVGIFPKIETRDGPSPQLLRGWYDLDVTRSIWSRKNAALVLRSESSPQAVRLAGALPAASGGNRLEISCNGTRLGCVENPTESLLKFDAFFPGVPHPSGAPLVFQFATKSVFRPALLGHADDRTLGFALFRIELVE